MIAVAVAVAFVVVVVVVVAATARVCAVQTWGWVRLAPRSPFRSLVQLFIACMFNKKHFGPP